MYRKPQCNVGTPMKEYKQNFRKTVSERKKTVNEKKIEWRHKNGWTAFVNALSERNFFFFVTAKKRWPRVAIYDILTTEIWA